MNHPRGLNLMFLLVSIHEILLKLLLPDPRHTLFGFSGDNAVHLYIVSVNHYTILRILTYIDHLEDIEFLLCNHIASALLTSLLIFFLLWDFIIFEMFCLQEWLIFTMFLLKFTWSLSDFGS